MISKNEDEKIGSCKELDNAVEITDEVNKQTYLSNEKEASNPQEQHTDLPNLDEEIIVTLASLINYEMDIDTKVHEI